MSRKEHILSHYSREIAEIKAASLSIKEELPITSMQGRAVTLADGRKLLNMCANNYLRTVRPSAADQGGKKILTMPRVTACPL